MPEHRQKQQSKNQEPSYQRKPILTNQTHVSNPATITQRARINPKSLTPADVLQLQRTIGNRAVGRLLAEIRKPSFTVQQLPIQRQEIPEEEPLQGTFESKPDKKACLSCIQRQEVPEEEEPLQGKMYETIQRLEPEDEEKPLQGIFEEKHEQPCLSCSTASIQKKEENHTGMPDNLKAGVENLSGIDMSNVRVHYNSSKPAEVGALAYTKGTDIHVAPGQERHLPHEAWHVVQQAQGRVRPTMQLKDGVSINDDKRLEREADGMGVRALQVRRADSATFAPIAQATALEAQDRGSKEASEAPGAAIRAFGGKGRLSILSPDEKLKAAPISTPGLALVQRVEHSEEKEKLKGINKALFRAYTIKSNGEFIVKRIIKLGNLIDEVENSVETSKNKDYHDRLRKHADEVKSKILEVTKDLEKEIDLKHLDLNYSLKHFKKDNKVKEEFVTEEHMEAISNYCKEKNVILSIRDAGRFSLERIKEGAKPKPHTILEKSIKASSLRKHYEDASKALESGQKELPNIGEVNLNDLKGFVGHWKNDELLGLRIDMRDVKDMQHIKNFVKGGDTDSPYIPLEEFKNYRNAMGDTWQQFLYTGDYDLHEIYKNKKALPEGSPEKATVLTGINKQIAHVQQENEKKGSRKLPLRGGTFESKKGERKAVDVGNHRKKYPNIKPAENDVQHKRIVRGRIISALPDAQYAMIQHGDQMGYITDKINEGWLHKEEDALLDKDVAQESSASLAWCVRGEWYVTENKYQHELFRKLVSVTSSSGWTDEMQAKIKSGGSPVMKLTQI